MATLYVATSTQEWKAPEPVGHLVITDGFQVAVYKRPNLFHMFMTHLFFGWDYEPVEGE